MLECLCRVLLHFFLLQNRIPYPGSIVCGGFYSSESGFHLFFFFIVSTPNEAIPFVMTPKGDFYMYIVHKIQEKENKCYSFIQVSLRVICSCHTLNTTYMFSFTYVVRVLFQFFVESQAWTSGTPHLTMPD